MNPFTRNPNVKYLALRSLLIAALIMFIAGITSPIMTITQFIFLESNFSIISGLTDLLTQQQYFLFILIGLLSLCLPLVKMGLLGWVLFTKPKTIPFKRTLNLIHNYGRWAMLDVMVIAILLVSIKLGAIASVEIHAGLYWFACSIIIVMIVTHYVSKDQQKIQ